MAITASGLYGPFLRDMFLNAKAFNFSDDDTSGGDTFKIDLQSNSATPNFDTHDEVADLTNILTGGSWSAAQTIATTATDAATIASGVLTFDAGDVSVGTTTITAARGGTIWDSTLAGSPLICTINFVTDYTSTNGTFAITFSGSGIFTIDYTP